MKRVEMMSDLANVTFQLTEPWKRWEYVDVHNPSEVIKMMYDVDVEHSDHATAWKIYKHLLLQVPSAQKMIVQCDEKMKTVKKHSNSEDGWRVTAKLFLQQRIESDKADVKEMKKERAKARARYIRKFGDI